MFAAPKKEKEPPPKKVTATAPVKRDKDDPPITATHAILIDAENGSVLFERNADQLIYPASLAKLMTVEYVLHLIKEGKLKLTDEFPVSENAWRKGGAPSHTSTMFAALNSRLTSTRCCTPSSYSPRTTPASFSPRVSQAPRPSLPPS